MINKLYCALIFLFNKLINMTTIHLNEDVNQKLNIHEDMQILRKLTRHIAHDKAK